MDKNGFPNYCGHSINVWNTFQGRFRAEIFKKDTKGE